MSRASHQASAVVIPLPVRQVDPRSPAALIQLANRRRAWNDAHPHATDDELIDAWAEIAEELGL